MHDSTMGVFPLPIVKNIWILIFHKKLFGSSAELLKLKEPNYLSPQRVKGDAHVLDNFQQI